MYKNDLESDWKWKNFKTTEIECKGETCGCGGELWLSKYNNEIPTYFMESMDALQRLRDAWGKPIMITFAHRCENHNRSVGGAKGSRHMAIAFDCVVVSSEQSIFAVLAAKCGFNGIGLYPRRSFVHLDMRASDASWVK